MGYPTTRSGLGRLVLYALLPPAAVLIAPAIPAAAATSAVAGGAYSMAATVSPAPMTPAECVRDPRCVAAAAPAGKGADDQPALARSVAAAASKAKAAILAPAKAAAPAIPATVLLATGTYTLARPLELPPNVTLRGRGITTTTLLLAPGSLGNFGYSFLLRPADAVSAGSSNTVSDLTVNGGCRTGAGKPDPAIPPVTGCAPGTEPSRGGGIDAGDRWTIRQVRFTNFNYFGLWIAGTHDVHAVDNRFDGWGGSGSAGVDNIGGGADATGTVIENNQFDATIQGNSIDLTNATTTTIRANTFHATRAFLSARRVSTYGDVYLEAVTAATVTDNVFYGAHLVLQSNSRYDHIGRNANVTNPRGVTVTGNQIIDSFGNGITVSYDDYPTAEGRHQMRPGRNSSAVSRSRHQPWYMPASRPMSVPNRTRSR